MLFSAEVFHSMPTSGCAVAVNAMLRQRACGSHLGTPKGVTKVKSYKKSHSKFTRHLTMMKPLLLLLETVGRQPEAQRGRPTGRARRVLLPAAQGLLPVAHPLQVPDPGVVHVSGIS
jgi:hypothetical protein